MSYASRPLRCAMCRVCSVPLNRAVRRRRIDSVAAPVSWMRTRAATQSVVSLQARMSLGLAARLQAAPIGSRGGGAPDPSSTLASTEPACGHLAGAGAPRDGRGLDVGDSISTAVAVGAHATVSARAALVLEGNYSRRFAPPPCSWDPAVTDIEELAPTSAAVEAHAHAISARVGPATGSFVFRQPRPRSSRMLPRVASVDAIIPAATAGSAAAATSADTSRARPTTARAGSRAWMFSHTRGARVCEDHFG